MSEWRHGQVIRILVTSHPAPSLVCRDCANTDTGRAPHDLLNVCTTGVGTDQQEQRVMIQIKIH